MQQTKTDSPGRTTGLLVREGAMVSITRSEYDAMLPLGYKVTKTVLHKGPKGSQFLADRLDLRKWYTERLEEIQVKCPTCLCPACESGYHEDTVYGDFQCECPCHGTGGTR